MTSRKKDDQRNIVPGRSDMESNAGGTGIALRSIWLVASHFEDAGFQHMLEGNTVPGPGKALSVIPEAGIWLNEEGSAAIVQLTVSVRPESQPSFSVRVSYAAHYEVISQPILALDVFARNNGLANLVPYVRAQLAALTSESHYQTFLLQPLNLTEALEAGGAALRVEL